MRCVESTIGKNVGKVFFGTGLASSKEESRGFGFELLYLVLTALEMKNELGAIAVHHEIGTVGYNISVSILGRLVEEQVNLIVNMAENLGIEDYYHVELSNSYHGDSLYRDIYRKVENTLSPFYRLANFQKYGDYTIIQIAQMKYLYLTENARVKVGWVVSSQPIPDKVDADKAEELIVRGNLNEFYFDSMYRFVFPKDDFSFVYTDAGIDIMDGKRYAPYTVTQSQSRPLLLEPIKPYLSGIPESKHKKRALKHYEKNIVNNWERLFGEIDAYRYLKDEDQLVDKLQYIQDRILGMRTA